MTSKYTLVGNMLIMRQMDIKKKLKQRRYKSNKLKLKNNLTL